MVVQFIIHFITLFPPHHFLFNLPMLYYFTTSLRDIVPHNPFTNLGYMHIFSEWYENEYGQVSYCDGYENKTCADQWIFDESTADHIVYLGQKMWCTDF